MIASRRTAQQKATEQKPVNASWRALRKRGHSSASALRKWSGLQWLARRAHEVPQHRDIRSVGADAAGIHRQTETLGEIEVHTGVVQFRQAKALCRQYPVQTGWVNWPWGPVALPRPARQFVKLLPIAFVPSGHFVHAVPLLTNVYPLRCLVGCSIALESGIQLPQVVRRNPVFRYKLSPGLLTIYACASSARHFVAYCFKPVTGLIVSRTFALAAGPPFGLEPGRVTCRFPRDRPGACILRA